MFPRTINILCDCESATCCEGSFIVSPHSVISMEMKSRVSIVIIVLTRVTTVTTELPGPSVSTRVSKIKLNGPMLGIRLVFACEKTTPADLYKLSYTGSLFIIIHPRRRQNDIKVILILQGVVNPEDRSTGESS